jgi:plastocyanin
MKFLHLPAAAIAVTLTMSPSFAQDTTINIKSFHYMPMDVSVTPGSRVTWKNLDEEPHTVTSETGVFASGGMDTNETFSFKFDKPGVYKYRCSIHPFMTATITVK